MLSKDTTLSELCDIPAFISVKDALISGGDFFSGERRNKTLEDIHRENPTWDVDDMLYGLGRLQDILRRDACVRYCPYDASACEEDAAKEAVSILYLKADHPRTKRFALLLAGGAYGAVCTMVESLPVAARLNSFGISCFCLNYRTATPESFVKGLLPKPIEDIAATLRFIQLNEARFCADGSEYYLGGFSAGGHAASLWGTAHRGAENYGLPQARALLLAYPLITMEHVPDGGMKQYMCAGMFGKDCSLDMIRDYDASLHMTDVYPKTFIVRCKDDPVVSALDADGLKKALDAYGIPCRLEEGARGGHGFGLGTQTSVSGWVERALRFAEE